MIQRPDYNPKLYHVNIQKIPSHKREMVYRFGGIPKIGFNFVEQKGQNESRKTLKLKLIVPINREFFMPYCPQIEKFSVTENRYQCHLKFHAFGEHDFNLEIISQGPPPQKDENKLLINQDPQKHFQEIFDFYKDDLPSMKIYHVLYRDQEWAIFQKKGIWFGQVKSKTPPTALPVWIKESPRRHATKIKITPR